MALASFQSDQPVSIRWIILLAAAALLHLLAIGWVGGYIGMPVQRQPRQNIISAQLPRPPGMAAPTVPHIPPPSPPKPARPPATKPRPRRPAPPIRGPA